MKQKEFIKSQIKISNILILLLGGIICTFLGIKLTISAVEKLGILFVSIPFLFMGIASIYYLINYDILEITKEKLILKSLFGFEKKSIYLSEIKSYNEIKKQNAKFKNEIEYMEWKDLTLFGENFRIKISSSSYGNYPELRKALIKGKKRNIKSENEWHRKNTLYFGIGFLIFGIIISIWFGIISKDLNKKLLSVGFSSLFIIYGIYLIRKTKKAYR
ncbi:hypothetical protein [uncultured Polaribacter sp.]|uniref:hypothetical protein n=1 Tax=uncultured Polaribacter sp. TaxID=174711 RepID=UPI0026391604|nr:hypothetical protein [uncultured Polaribacter sp.]